MVRKNADPARKDEESVLVAIDKDKGSQYALKWAVDHILSKGQSVTLLHVRQKSPSQPEVPEEVSRTTRFKQLESEARELFLPFRCFCTRKEIKCHEVMVDDLDIAKGIVDYASSHVIETLILGAPARGGLLVRKFKTTDVPSSVAKVAPDYCTIYVISKGKVSSVKSASAPVPPKPTPAAAVVHPSQVPSLADLPRRSGRSAGGLITLPERSFISQDYHEEPKVNRTPLLRHRGSIGKTHDPFPSEMDVSFTSSSTAKPSFEYRMNPPFLDEPDSDITPTKAEGTDNDSKSFASMYSTGTSIDMGSPYNYSVSSSASQDSGQPSFYSRNMEDVESEMRRLRLELRQTMDMYSSACKEAISAKEKNLDYQHRWKLEEQQRIAETSMALAEEKQKNKATLEVTQTAQRLALLEAQKGAVIEESHASTQDIEEKESRESWVPSDLRYRRYTTQEIEMATENFSNSLKVGEGGYGPVYKCYLDHTEVAVKVIGSDVAQGKLQFQREVEVLSCIRHPNMVLLLGACPEYGCLVYEYMANGSLDDRLFRKGNTPPLPWQMRFKIAAEIATGLLFLHQSKPEPLVHRDLKPGNILLDRYFVSKISDVGLARLVPPSVSNAVTQYHMTSTAGTFCYIDPEYQQTGMLGTKSDVYSLGIILLQIITAKSPMGLAHLVQSAVEDECLSRVLDPTVPDWPVEETLSLAKLALQCAELRKKDRPDLAKVILPELNRFRLLAEASSPYLMFGGIFSSTSIPIQSHISSLQETMSDANYTSASSGFSSCSSSSSASSSSSYSHSRRS